MGRADVLTGGDADLPRHAATVTAGPGDGRSRTLDFLIQLGKIIISLFEIGGPRRPAGTAGVRQSASARVDLARIRQEASGLANRFGIDGLSMNALAEALSIRTPSLYAHVSGIGEVKRLLAIQGLEDLDRTATRVTIGKSGRDAVRALLMAIAHSPQKTPGYMPRPSRRRRATTRSGGRRPTASTKPAGRRSRAMASADRTSSMRCVACAASPMDLHRSKRPAR